jgi:S-adenosylmethionine hydrolase
MITLSSDFGSPYPAAMKGVIKSRCDAELVDVAHDFPRQDVRAAAFWLREVLPYFPPAVHLVVVDPGVGTDRAAIAIRAGESALVGPDNGVLLPAARRLVGREEAVEAFEIEYEDPASVTFHGRDVFAPAAAEVHDVGVDRMGESSILASESGYEEFTFPEPETDEAGASGEVLVVDGFGNAITNVPGEVLEGRFGGRIEVNGGAVPVEPTYAALEPGERLVTVGSHGNVELAVNRGRGEAAFGVGVGETIRLEW